ncbi:hypothetical protein BM1374166_02055 [Bartonella tribocorum]|nr:hypothetical protein BM1374166_02055 [Bartonella tribocorum]
MAVESKGIFTRIDNMLMEPLTEITDNIHCPLAAQLKELYALYITFMARLCRCPRFIITGCETTYNTSII